MERIKLLPIRVYLAVQALRDREDGQAMVEYALILALVSVGVVAILKLVGTNVTNIFSTVNDDV